MIVIKIITQKNFLRRDFKCQIRTTITKMITKTITTRTITKITITTKKKTNKHKLCIFKNAELKFLG